MLSLSELRHVCAYLHQIQADGEEHLHGVKRLMSRTM